MLCISKKLDTDCTFNSIIYVDEKKCNKWTKNEKESILKDIQRVGVVAGCRKHDIATRTYYDWLDKYNTHGIDGLDRKHGASADAELKQLRKENRLLKEILAEKE